MIKVKVITIRLETNEEIEEFDRSEVLTTIRDAFAEFIASRGGGNAEDYVATRYPELVKRGKSAEKVAEVNRRLTIARVLRRAETFKVDDAALDLPYEYRF